MTGTSYRRSAELAGIVGPYEGYARNADAHKRVMRKHQAANDALRTVGSLDSAPSTSAPRRRGTASSRSARRNGYRNAQASVLAPTGTIGFMMDCDTTGIEPDFSLVKFKKLVGGGSMQIVNQTIPRALKRLGYAGETVEAIVEYIAENGHVVDAPGPATRALRGVRHRDGPASDQADGSRPDDGGRAAVPVRRHLQDGEPARVRDRRRDRRGLPAGLEARSEGAGGLPRQLQGRPAALRRQATSDAKTTKAAEAATEPKAVGVEKVVYRPTRKRLPKARPSQTRSFSVGGAEGYMISGSYPDDGLGEVFLKLGKQGSTLAGVMDAFSIAVSIALQYGVPLETYVQKFTNLKFEPAGLTDDPDIRMAQSIMDYIFRRLALDYLSFDERAELGIYTADRACPSGRDRVLPAGRGRGESARRSR